jgi:hypothetical protein
VVPAICAIFLAVRRHYDRVATAIAIAPAEVRPEPQNHTVVVLVGRIHRGVLKALAYARSLRPNHLVAVYISYDEDDANAMQDQWDEYRIETALEIVSSPYRELVDAVDNYLDELDERWHNDTVTVIIPEFVVEHWYENVLHNQSALALKFKLLGRHGTVVTSVPYHLRSQVKSD